MKRKTAKIKVPSSIKIGYLDYTVLPISAEHAELRNIEGELRHTKQLIEYDESLPLPIAANTILHECLHAIIIMQGITFEESETEEKLVNSLANGLSSLFKDNPDLCCFIANCMNPPNKDNE